MARLAAPTNVRVEETPEGFVHVSWDAVQGATRYHVGRAVGTNGFQRLADGTVGTPSYMDRAVRAGIKHVYLITPVDQAGVAGGRARSDSIVPGSAPRAATVTPPAGVQAQVTGDMVRVSWTRQFSASYRVRVSHDGGPFLVVADRITAASYGARVPAPGRYQYEVAAYGTAGQLSAPVLADPVVVASVAVADTTATATGGTTAGTSGTAGGWSVPTMSDPQVLVTTKTEPVVLRVGVTRSLASSAGSGWMSLAPAVATVTADGLVTARAPGVSQVVRVTQDAGNLVRVTVVSVQVTP